MKKSLPIFALITIAGCNTTPMSSQQISAPLTVVESARSYLVQEFKDPPAAMFRSERVYRIGNGDYAVCGEVNGKNSFGAYIGYQPYYVRMSQAGAGKIKHTEWPAQTACNQAASGTIQIAQ